MKSEPDVYSIDTLKKDKRGSWDGVRNYRARNFMRDEMRIGDWVLFYHSNAKPPGVAGLATVCREAYPDHTQFDKKSEYFDPKAKQEEPRWFMVDVKFEEKFKNFVTLEELKGDPRFEDMLVVQRGQRLSIQPVERRHFDLVCKLGRGGVRDSRK